MYICDVCRSSKAVLPSLAKNHTVLVNSQIRWRTDVAQHWSNATRSSALVGSEPLQKSNKVIQLLGRQKPIIFTNQQLKWIQDVYGSYTTPISTAFREFCQAYASYVLDCKKKKTQPAPFRSWQVYMYVVKCKYVGI